MKHIVVLTNFESYTHNALNYAIHLASKSNSTLSIFDSSKSCSAQTFAASLFQAIENDLFSFPDFVNSYFRSLKNIFSKELLKSVRIIYKSQDEFDIADINQTHSQHPFDLLIISTKERKGIFNKIFRNNVSKLIDKAIYPVLAIPSKVQFSEIKKISVATNLINKDYKIFETGYDLSINFDAAFNFVHISKEENKDLKNLKLDFFSHIKEHLGTDKFYLTKRNNDSILKGLKKYSAKNSNSILFIKKKNKSGFEKIIKGMWEKLIFTAHSPILVYSELNTSNPQITEI